ncbi:5-formyltetrahydrofolate cyclo-ligase [Bosea sp. (in: a-proteobacteria)]|uniref:5-formyltetrahydrofolate cyclo-ligase n=1 Tax=Bosea sp. (in: a-proteobacteria) TaxID=1871050 RepID=UPI002601BD88|nr:5-formyltetrahydrofolate cyclo-ligase [Bosea sp. (in: a-proteobacteria)]MCO5089959.1 5-formyltetrahydrofolate cyclo-ligase [Bosea sp. (in: a-proteobacteria)]
MGGDDDEPAGYASPPCFLHEVDPAWSGLAPAPDPSPAAWRRAERERLIAARLALPAATRTAFAQKIAGHLDALIGDPAGVLVSGYWPFRGEPDLRSWLGGLAARGGHAALPVVVARGEPLLFRPWRAGDRLERGVWNIPVPAAGEPVFPRIVVAPLVGFDAEGYRLGYGGGFFDRTLAALPPSAIAIGVGYEMAAMATIRPHGFDIPMRYIVTETGIRSCRGERGSRHCEALLRTP